MSAGVEISLLGPLQVRCDGAVVAVPVGKQRALLAVLLMQAGRNGAALLAVGTHVVGSLLMTFAGIATVTWLKG